MRPNQRLKRFLASRGYSQTELARLIGCHSTFVNRLLAGNRRAHGAIAFAIEDLTRDWDEGPIDAREWVRVPLRKAS